MNIQRGRAKSAALKQWEHDAGWTWRAEGAMPKEPLAETSRWGWSGAFYFPTHAKRDIDNHTKHIADLIVRVVFGGAPDDRYMVWTQHTKQVDGKHPGVGVTVYEMDTQGDPVVQGVLAILPDGRPTSGHVAAGQSELGGAGRPVSGLGGRSR